MTIRARYALATSVLLAAVLASTAALVVQLQRRIVRREIAQRQEAVMEGVARLGQEALAARDQLMLLSYIQAIQREHPELGPAEAVFAGHRVVIPRGARAEGPGLIVLERELAGGGGAEPSNVRLSFRAAAIRGELGRAMRPFIRAVAALAALAMLLGALAASYLARLLTRPIADMAAAVTAVGEGNLEVALPARGDDEVARLSRRFNQMTARLREIDRFKADLLHTLTHELNTPLMGLSSHLELMKDRPDAARDSRTAAMMLAAVQRMSEALQNTLRLFSAEHGARRRAAWEPVDVAGILAEACRLFAPAAEAMGVRLEPPQAPADGAVLSDPELVRQIITNLLSNALKYTPEGGQVAAGLLVRPADVALWVRDSGVGIPRERLSRLFQRFDRSAGAQGVAQRVSGAGLGLSIVANAVAALRGQVKVESEEGKGSTFWVFLPRLRREERA